MLELNLFDKRLMNMSLDLPVVQTKDSSISAKQVIEALTIDGTKVYIAGGSPRDWLSGYNSPDIDINLSCSIEQAHKSLRLAFQGIDPVLFTDLDFGLLVWGQSSEHHIDINILRDISDVTAKSFTPRSSIGTDFLTRDFAFNSMYYDYQEEIILDPTGNALDDLEKKRLRIVTDPTVFACFHTLSFRICKFLIKGYHLDQSSDSYLKNYLQRDLELYSDWEWEAFLEHHLHRKGYSVKLYLNALDPDSVDTVIFANKFPGTHHLKS